ncbi:hypothetical protein AKL17_3p0181 (plasmid) [Frigidibacter mobilis]|uniref:Uncharacterized protein n=1 Tax=Frigidibacter mobilis TaxID=1335048 RepID=A0A159Z9Q8_9RHOB|nr:hypothetical protein AKL17_3p0181 [Frigidibacter mobilis]
MARSGQQWQEVVGVALTIQTLRHAHVRRMARSGQQWQEVVGVALTHKQDSRRVY